MTEQKLSFLKSLVNDLLRRYQNGSQIWLCPKKKKKKNQKSNLTKTGILGAESKNLILISWY